MVVVYTLYLFTGAAALVDHVNNVGRNSPHDKPAAHRNMVKHLEGGTKKSEKEPPPPSLAKH